MQLRHEVTMAERQWNEFTFDIVAVLVCDVDPAVPEYNWKGHAEVEEWDIVNVIVYDNMGEVIQLEIPENVIDEQGNKWLDDNEEKVEAELWDVFERENEYHDG